MVMMGVVVMFVFAVVLHKGAMISLRRNTEFQYLDLFLQLGVYVFLKWNPDKLPRAILSSTSHLPNLCS